MGTTKEGNRRKQSNLHVRMTDSEMETVRRNTRAAGYLSVSRYVRDRLTRRKSPTGKTAMQETGYGLDWLRENMDGLTGQIRSAVSGYNECVNVMTALTESMGDIGSRQQIIRRASRLDGLTREMIEALHSIKDIAERVEKEGRGRDAATVE